MTSDRGLQGALHSWLHEDQHEDATRILHTVLDGVGTTPQHRPRWSVGGMLTMNKFVGIGLGTAAVVAVLFIGAQLRGTPVPGGPSPTQSAAPSEAPASVEPSSPSDGSLPVGPHVMDNTNVPNNPTTVTVTIPATGWFAEPDRAAVTKDLGGGDRVTVVVAPADYYGVPADICNWRLDDASAQPFPNSIDEFMAALAAQIYDSEHGLLPRELSTPVDVTIDGSPGLSITSVVPMDYHVDPSACDEQRLCSVLDREGDGCQLSHLEPGALDTVWVVQPPDFYYLVVAASYWPTTSSELLAEMNAIVDSMTEYERSQ